MSILMILGFLLTLFLGVGMLMTAKSVMHEIEGCVLLLMSTVFFSSLGIINAVDKFQRRMEHRWPASPQTSVSVEPRENTGMGHAGQSDVTSPLPEEHASRALAEAQAPYFLATLPPQHRAEAQGYIETLAAAGYPQVINHGAEWDITTPSGRVAATVRTLEELRDAVQRLA